MKRAVDLVVATVALIPALPVLAACVALILATSGWPPLIVQTRVGADERPIQVIKLRTMKRGTPTVAKSELGDRPELYVPLGRFFRRSSLDELPQLLNVIIGTMSLVGPRPALPSQRDLLTLRRKHGITPLKPGITGLAQVLGREDLTLSTKVRSEALYARRRSLWLDLLLLAWTVRAVAFGRGAR